MVAPQPVRNKQYNVSKLTGARNEDGSLQGGGAGFNQFDPILFLSGLISRRFGIVGGLTVVAMVASTEGFEIFKSLSDTGPVAGSGTLRDTPAQQEAPRLQGAAHPLPSAHLR